MDDKTNITLWRELGDEDGKSVTEFKHKQLTRHAPCAKCNTHNWGFCPIPDQYPGSPADIAEKIREWMAEHEKEDYYYDSLRETWLATADYDCEGEFSEWLIMHCTPADKITAFASLFKENQNE